MDPVASVLSLCAIALFAWALLATGHYMCRVAGALVLGVSSRILSWAADLIQFGSIVGLWGVRFSKGPESTQSPASPFAA